MDAIKRYNLIDSSSSLDMMQAKKGAWIKYEDHLAALKQSLAQPQTMKPARCGACEQLVFEPCYSADCGIQDSQPDGDGRGPVKLKFPVSLLMNNSVQENLEAISKWIKSYPPLYTRPPATSEDAAELEQAKKDVAQLREVLQLVAPLIDRKDMNERIDAALSAQDGDEK